MAPVNRQASGNLRVGLTLTKDSTPPTATRPHQGANPVRDPQPSAGVSGDESGEDVKDTVT
jgi:hypothetical protein